jgi:hypothetical protein
MVSACFLVRRPLAVALIPKIAVYESGAIFANACKIM